MRTHPVHPPWLRACLKSSLLLCVRLSLIKILFSSEKPKSCDVMSLRTFLARQSFSRTSRLVNFTLTAGGNKALSAFAFTLLGGRWLVVNILFFQVNSNLSTELNNNFVRIFPRVARNLCNTPDFQAVLSRVLFKFVK